MPKLSDTSVPAYRHHKASDQAVVWLDGREIYLGKYKSTESKAEYSRLIAEWLAGGRRLPTEKSDITIAEIVLAFRKYAKGYYRIPDGRSTSEIAAFDAALKPLVKLYGRLPAGDFSPLKLKAVRDEMIRLDWARVSNNKHLSRVRHLFKWGVQNELVNPSILHGLQAVGGLRAGRSEAREVEPIKPVELAHVEAVYPFVSAEVGAMIRLQLTTGMRSGEVCIMRTKDIDRSGRLWKYTPAHHKTQNHGHSRNVFLGPKAQEIITPFLKLDPDAYLFDPRQAETRRRLERFVKRKTPHGYGNTIGTNRKRHPQRTIGERYDVATCRRAIARACDLADCWHKGGRIIANDERVIPHWHPHQLRHTAATELRKAYGLEAAQCILGHKSLSVTELYAEKNIEQAMRIMADVG